MHVPALVDERHRRRDFSRFFQHGHLALPSGQPLYLRAVHACLRVDAQHISHALHLRRAPRRLLVEVRVLLPANGPVEPLGGLDAVALLPPGLLGSRHRHLRGTPSGPPLVLQLDILSGQRNVIHP
jgi:hypothetical protein